MRAPPRGASTSCAGKTVSGARSESGTCMAWCRGNYRAAESGGAGAVRGDVAPSIRHSCRWFGAHALLPDLLEDRAGHAAGRREDGSLVVHRPEERLAGGIDEGDLVELDADRAGVPDGLPAAGELVHPRAGEPSLERERHTLGACGDRDPQHALRRSDTGRKRRAGGPSRRGAVDAELPDARLEGRSLETETRRSPVRTAEDPVRVVQRTENGL